MLFQVAANQFIVVKKTWPNLFILSSGAVLNIIINYLLIPFLGIEGASIATLAGYVVSDIVCAIVLCRMKLLIISRRFVISCSIMIVFFLLWRLLFSNKIIIGTVACLVVTGSEIFMYKIEIEGLLNVVKKKMKKISSR
jgi:O-antigen/teichoic acid export membrane protein